MRFLIEDYQKELIHSIVNSSFCNDFLSVYIDFDIARFGSVPEQEWRLNSPANELQAFYITCITNGLLHAWFIHIQVQLYFLTLDLNSNRLIPLLQCAYYLL